MSDPVMRDRIIAGVMVTLMFIGGLLIEWMERRR